jgi:Zn-finger nucleic acid-binding protein
MSPFRTAPPLPEPLACPRDRQVLVARVAEDETLHVCPKCIGIWLDAATLERLRGDRLAMDALARHPLAAVASRGSAPDTLPPIACPSCRAHCVRRLFGRGADALVIDTCREHGVWLDGGELHAFMREERGDRRPATTPPPPRPPRRPLLDDERMQRAVDDVVDFVVDVWRILLP